MRSSTSSVLPALRVCCALFCVVANHSTSSFADTPPRIETVFVIAMENHNWTQPASQSSPQQIYNNANAPFINSIVNPSFNGGALNPQATLFGDIYPISINSQLSYATAYHNAGTTHPSEPNYLWAEGGTSYGVTNDNPPFGTNGNNQTTTAHLTTYLQQAGHTWKSYQEDIDTDSAGNVLPQNQWVSPITNRSGTYTTVANAYNGSKQYDYAVKHNPPAFFTDTNGGNNTTSSNPAAVHYAPLQQLQTDLNNNTVADYNWITPNQFNDMHSALSGGYKGLTGDNAQIRQGDNFLSIIVPRIMASQAYKNNGAIVIWNDESENGDDPSRTIMEIVISPLAKGYGYASTLNYTHSSDLKTMQEIFQAGPFLGGAASAGTLDLSDMFLANAIPNTVSLAGDYNHDAVVEAADYVKWRRGLNTTYTPADYDIWRSHFGQWAGNGSGSSGILGGTVPEPRSMSVLVFAVFLLFARSSRNKLTLRCVS